VNVGGLTRHCSRRRYRDAAQLKRWAIEGETEMLPKVIIHSGISVDGRIEGYRLNIWTYYGLAGASCADTVLEGADTAAHPDEEIPPEEPADFQKPSNPENKPLKVIPDSRGRLRNWHVHRRDEHCGDVVALVSNSTPGSFLEYLSQRNFDYIVAGEDHVDYRLAFEELNVRYGTTIIRTDSGGILNNILLQQGLVSEISLLIAPFLVGTSPRGLFRTLDIAPTKAISLKLKSMQQIDDDCVWLRYDVV